MAGRPNELTFCSEVADLSPAHIAVALIQARRDYVELAARVHARSDVPWSMVTDVKPDPQRATGAAAMQMEELLAAPPDATLQAAAEGVV